MLRKYIEGREREGMGNWSLGLIIKARSPAEALFK